MIEINSMSVFKAGRLTELFVPRLSISLPFLLASFALYGAPATAFPTSATMLIEQCRGFLTDARSEPGKICAAYISGFFAGSRNSGALITGASRGVLNGMQARNLHSGVPVNRTRYCLSENLSVSALVGELVAFSASCLSLSDKSGNELLKEMMKSRHSCRSWIIRNGISLAHLIIVVEPICKHQLLVIQFHV